jgi:hypothetical protein
MRDDILTYRELCDKENVQTIQRGMNYRLNKEYSVILMSQRGNAPYKDRIYEDGITIEYEGHDTPKSDVVNNPKQINQPAFTKTGRPIQNGLFITAVENYKSSGKFEIIKVYFHGRQTPSSAPCLLPIQRSINLNQTH